MAEGVETEAQRAVVAEQGCDEIQGVLLGRPQAAADVGRLSSRHAERSRAPRVHRSAEPLQLAG